MNEEEIKNLRIGSVIYDSATHQKNFIFHKEEPTEKSYLGRYWIIIQDIVASEAGYTYRPFSVPGTWFLRTTFLVAL